LKMVTWLIVIVIPVISLRGMLYVSKSWRDIMPIVFLWAGGFGIHFVGYFVLRSMDLFSPYQLFVTVSGLFFVIMTLFISNDERLKKSTLEKNTPPSISPTIKRMNIGIIIMTIVIIGIGYLRVVQDAFVAMIGFIVRLIFSGGGEDEEELIEEEPPDESGEMALPEGDNSFLSPIMKFLETIMLIILYVGLAAAAVLLVLLTMKKSRSWLRGRWVAFVAFLKRLTQSVDHEQESPYTDEKETVFDWEKWREKQKDKARGLFGKMFRRKQKWHALSNAEKVRWIYRDVVTPNIKDIDYNTALTARETLHKIEDIVETDGGEMQLLRRYYEDSRYSAKEIDDQSIQKLTNIFQNSTKR